MIHVLLVEDNYLVREMVAERLSLEGFRVTAVTDGEQALDIIDAVQPEVILMDMGLPGIDGWQVTRQLKAAPRTGRIPVIALTAFTSRQDIQKSLQAGCDDLEFKPIHFQGLLDKIQRLAHTGDSAL